MLKSALDAHSKIRCHGELFHPTVHSHSMLRLGAIGHLESFKLGPVDGFVIHGFIPPEGPPFIDIYEDLWQALRVFQVPMIALRRRDQIRRLASHLIAGERRQWRRLPSQGQTVDTVAINPEALLRSFHSAQANDMLTEQWYPWAHVAYYEDLVNAWPVEVRKIQQYLDVPVEAVVPQIAKQDSRPIRQIVTNYDELKAKLGHQADVAHLFRVAEEGTSSNGVPTKLQDLK